MNESWKAALTSGAIWSVFVVGVYGGLVAAVLIMIAAHLFWDFVGDGRRIDIHIIQADRAAPEPSQEIGRVHGSLDGRTS